MQSKSTAQWSWRAWSRSGWAWLGGMLLPGAFAPFNYYGVAEVSLILLLVAWRQATPKQAASAGWCFGSAFLGGGIYWVYISIHHYGQAPVAIAGLVTVGLVALLAGYFALSGYLLQRYYSSNSTYKLAVAFPSLWVLSEALRGKFLSGFPWLFLGYGQMNTPLRGWATILGVYGVSFAVAQSAGLLFLLGSWRGEYRKQLGALLGLLLIWGGGLGLMHISWTTPSAEKVRIAIIQGNVAQEQKWRPEMLRITLDRYLELTASHLDRDLIIWPEAAIPTIPELVEEYLAPVVAAVQQRHAAIISGAPCYDRLSGHDYNGMVVLGTAESKYYKRKLVPFGEYLPLRWGLSWLHRWVVIPMAGFKAGDRQQPPLIAAGVTIAPLICYEVAYPELVLAHLPQAEVIVTVSDDSWFGRSIAAAQHLEIAQMRSLETGRSQLLATNTGISAVIDEHGRVIQQTPLLQTAVLRAEISPRQGATPWVGYGRYLWLPLLLLGLGGGKMIDRWGRFKRLP